MDKVISLNPEKLLNAIRIWTGWGGIAPNRDDSRLMQQLGLTDVDIL